MRSRKRRSVWAVDVQRFHAANAPHPAIRYLDQPANILDTQTDREDGFDFAGQCMGSRKIQPDDLTCNASPRASRSLTSSPRSAS